MIEQQRNVMIGVKQRSQTRQYLVSLNELSEMVSGFSELRRDPALDDGQPPARNRAE
jgi:hypothetical protein